MTALLLVGAGHAHVEVLRRFGRRRLAGVRLTLLTRAASEPYSGMVPGVAAGLYGAAAAQFDVRALAERAGARLVLAEATGLDLAARQVLTQGCAESFGVLSLDTGGRPDTAAVPGAADHAIPVRPLDALLAGFAAVLAGVQAGRVRRIVMAGGGAAGVELVLAMAHRLRAEAASVELTLVCGANGLLPGLPAGARAWLAAALAAAGVAVRAGERVAAVMPGGVRLAGGACLPADAVFWAAGAASPRWLRGSGLPLDGAGYVRVDRHLRAAPGVFAAGDMVAGGARSGVQAVRAGPVLAANLRAAVAGGRLRRARPGAAGLAIVGTGDGAALAVRGRLWAGGRWAWRLKAAIDRRAMARLAAGGPG